MITTEKLIDIHECVNECWPYFEPVREDYINSQHVQTYAIAWIALGIIGTLASVFSRFRYRNHLANRYILSILSMSLIIKGIYHLYHPSPPYMIEIVRSTRLLIAACSKHSFRCIETIGND